MKESIKMIKGLAEKLIQLRRESKLSLDKVAVRVGVSKSSVYAWEVSLSQPSLISLIRLAKLYGVSTDYLLGIEKRSIDVTGISDNDVRLLTELAESLRKK